MRHVLRRVYSRHNIGNTHKNRVICVILGTCEIYLDGAMCHPMSDVHFAN